MRRRCLLTFLAGGVRAELCEAATWLGPAGIGGFQPWAQHVDDRLARYAQKRAMEHLATLTDEDVASDIEGKTDHVAVEFSRRLVITNRDLIQAIRDFESASNTASRWLLAVTVALVALTVVIAILTWVLVVKT